MCIHLSRLHPAWLAASTSEETPREPLTVPGAGYCGKPEVGGGGQPLARIQQTEGTSRLPLPQLLTVMSWPWELQPGPWCLTLSLAHVLGLFSSVPCVSETFGVSFPDSLRGTEEWNIRGTGIKTMKNECLVIPSLLNAIRKISAFAKMVR